MSGARRPNWGHDAWEMSLNLGRKLRPCSDGCGAYILMVKAPKGGWMPLEKVGEEPNPDFPGKVLHIVEIHHDNCTNQRVPGERDPMRSHRIAKHEDKPEVPEAQQRFRLRGQESIFQEG